MANYMFLMQTDATELPLSVEYYLVRMTLVGVGLSVVGNLLSVFLVCYVPVRSDALFSTGNMCVALMGAQLAFAGAENNFPQKIFCKISTASLHFLFLAVHCWSLAFSVHLVFKMFRILHRRRARKRFILVNVGWAIPVLVVATTAVLSGDHYGDQRLCWLNAENGSKWAFVGPVCFIVTVNVLVLLLVLLVQWRHDTRKEQAMTRRVKNLLNTTLTQLPITNLTWLLGLTPVRYIGFQYLFVMINASQGMFIFVCHMMCSSQVRGLLKTRITGVPADGGDKPGEGASRSDSTGNTQSLEMEVVGGKLKTISFTKRDS